MWTAKALHRPLLGHFFGSFRFDPSIVGVFSTRSEDTLADEPNLAQGVIRRHISIFDRLPIWSHVQSKRCEPAGGSAIASEVICGAKTFHSCINKTLVNMGIHVRCIQCECKMEE